MVPDRGVYVGAYTDDINLEELDALTGVKHVARLEYMPFPDVLSDRDYISSVLAECKALGGVPLLTLEARDGLDMYSLLDVSEFAQWLATYDMRVILRWNHEMNGNWYPWGQRPTKYVEKFREFVSVVRQQAPRVEFAFTPNPQFGYPWGGRYDWSAEDIATLDTNNNGWVDQDDDAWTPYFPGVEYVDWVGMSFFWWGNPFSTNNVPPDNNFNAGWADFHAWSQREASGLPNMIPETGAFFDSLLGGDTEANIKMAWVEQIYNVGELASNTNIKLICWLNTIKVEDENGLTVDWRVSNPGSVTAYTQRITTDPFFVQRTHAPTASPSHPPTQLSPSPTLKPTTAFPSPEPTTIPPTAWPTLPPTHPPRPPSLPPFAEPAAPRPTWPRDDDDAARDDDAPSPRPSHAPTLDALPRKPSGWTTDDDATTASNVSLGTLVALAAFLGAFALLQLAKCAWPCVKEAALFVLCGPNDLEELGDSEDEEDEDNQGDGGKGKRKGKGRRYSSSSEEEDRMPPARGQQGKGGQQRGVELAPSLKSGSSAVQGGGRPQANGGAGFLTQEQLREPAPNSNYV